MYMYEWINIGFVIFAELENIFKFSFSSLIALIFFNVKGQQLKINDFLI